jgi:hypothetical protein
VRDRCVKRHVASAQKKTPIHLYILLSLLVFVCYFNFYYLFINAVMENLLKKNCAKVGGIIWLFLGGFTFSIWK